MEKRVKIITSIFVLVGLVFAFYFITKAITAYTGYNIAENIITEKQKIELAKCLGEKNVKMYGAYWCSHCNNQKAMFGDLFKHVIYVECDRNAQNSQRELCLEKGIEGYPTWEINNQFYAGEISFEKLAELSGCKI